MAGLLDDQWALVTGAGRGIGRAIALDLAREGASVALVSRTQEQLDQVADECQQAGAPQALVFATDLAVPEQVDHAAEFILSLSDGVHILVNNAGCYSAGQASEGEPHQWERMVAVNLLAPMRLTRRVVPGMIERGAGLIANIGAPAADDLPPDWSAFCASKAGLRAWSRSCRRSLSAHRIKVVLIEPSFVDTAMLHRSPLPETMDVLAPQDVSRLVLLAARSSPRDCPHEIRLGTSR